MLEIFCPYPELDDLDSLPDKFILIDHCNGFSQDLRNEILDKLQAYAVEKNKRFSIGMMIVIEPGIKEKYDRLDIYFNFERQKIYGWDVFENYKHPEISYENFVCSFNGTDHVSRKLLVSCLHKFGWFDKKYSSKNFSYPVDMLDGHIYDYVGQDDAFYRKFFISPDSEDFAQQIYSFGHVQYSHGKNIYNLEDKLTKSFLHLISETMATSYYPFITEKVVYSIVTRGLFLAYAPPGWHRFLEKYYGFKLYTKLFDYRFDSIQNPVERLVELMSMISKFSFLSVDDWHDLYQLERDTVEYNYNHHASKGYLKSLAKYNLYDI